MPVDRGKLKAYVLKKGKADLKGEWKNELKSKMFIKEFDGKTFSGIYHSHVSTEGPPVEGSLVGTMTGSALAFTVNWDPAFSAVTSWTGLLLTDGGALAIYTLWQLAGTPEKPDQVWDSISAGSDMFWQVDKDKSARKGKL
jgi:hypothetical protein